jgi:hypothetical protein
MDLDRQKNSLDFSRRPCEECLSKPPSGFPSADLLSVPPCWKASQGGGFLTMAHLPVEKALAELAQSL